LRNSFSKPVTESKSYGGGEKVKKISLILILSLLFSIFIPLSLGALYYQRDITTNGTTVAYNWSRPNFALTAWTPPPNVKLSVTANSTRELTNINWGNNVQVININYSRGYQESAHAILTLKNVGNVPVKINLHLASSSIAIPQTSIRVFWGMSSTAGPNITLQPGQIVQPSLAIAIVSNTPAASATSFSVHVMITATQA
jgi:hypothetical protein